MCTPLSTQLMNRLINLLDCFISQQLQIKSFDRRNEKKLIISFLTSWRQQRWPFFEGLELLSFRKFYAPINLFTFFPFENFWMKKIDFQTWTSIEFPMDVDNVDKVDNFITFSTHSSYLWHKLPTPKIRNWRHVL